MAAASSALLVTTGGVLYRLDWRANARGAPALTAMSETLDRADPEHREADAIAGSLGEDRVETDELRILKRVLPMGWSEALRDESREVRMGHLANARRRWGDRPLPKLPGPAQPNDYQKLYTVIPGLHRFHWHRPEEPAHVSAVALKKVKALVAARWFVIDEVERRVRERHAAVLQEAVQIDAGAPGVDDEPYAEVDYARDAMRRARAVLDDLRLLRELQRARLAEAF